MFEHKNAQKSPSDSTQEEQRPTSKLTLNWLDNSYNERGFKIRRRSPGTGGIFNVIGTVDQNVTTFTDSTVYAGLEYCYTVVAYNDSGESTASNMACGTPATTGKAKWTVKSLDQKTLKN